MLRVDSNFDNQFIGIDYVIGTSDASEYIPIVSATDMTYIATRIAIYHKPLGEFQERLPKLNRTTVTNRLERNRNLTTCIFNRVEDINVIIKVAKGYISDENDNILLMLASKKSHIHYTNSYDRYIDSNYSNAEFSKENIVLLLSTELMSNKKYSMLYKHLEKEYIADAYKQDIDVIFTTSAKIEKKCYSNNFKVEFNTIDELTNHLNSVVGQVVFQDDDFFHTVNPGMKKGVVQEVAVEEVESVYSGLTRERVNEVISEVFNRPREEASNNWINAHTASTNISHSVNNSFRGLTNSILTNSGNTVTLGGNHSFINAPILPPPSTNLHISRPREFGYDLVDDTEQDGDENVETEIEWSGSLSLDEVVAYEGPVDGISF